MKIFRPLNSLWLTQGFSDNKACVRTFMGQPIRPFQVLGKRGGTCPVNSTEFYPAIGMKGHNGRDYAGWEGEPQYFPAEADCEWWSRNEVDMDGGIGLDVFSDRPIDIGELPPEAGELAKADFKKYGGRVYVKFRFWHLKKSFTPDSKLRTEGELKGQRDTNVKFGQLIATTGNTGASSGTHLHFGMKIVSSSGATLDTYNGYYGAIDYSQWYEEEFVLDIVIVERQLEAFRLTFTETFKKILFELRQQLLALRKS